MDTANLIRYELGIKLTGYLPIPRELIASGLPSTAVLIYGALLDRATLSQKNGYANEDGWVYVIYPVERLAEAFHLSDTAVKRHLKELEQRGLIHRKREAKNGANHIYLNLPRGSSKATSMETKGTDQTPIMGGSRGTIVPPNNRKQQLDFNYYQYGEDESL